MEPGAPGQEDRDANCARAYALAGAAYQTVLEDGEYLSLAGRIEIDVFGDDFVQIPLGLGGGVLAKAELDGKAARLSVAAAAARCRRGGRPQTIALRVRARVGTNWNWPCG